MRSLFFAFTLLSAGSASAATITFEEFPETFGYTYVESGGFSVSANGYFQIIDLGGDKILGMQANTITIDSLSGDNFAVSSLNLHGYTGKTVALIGSLTGGGTIQSQITFANNGQNNVVLDSSWNNLESFQIQLQVTSGQTGIDDIVVSTVPVPAAVWLFGSALAALGWLKRKQFS